MAAGPQPVLSNQTRVDSFSDYISLRSYEANTLEARAMVSMGNGAAFQLKGWLVPMPQKLQRQNTQNYATVETSMAYTLQKLQSSGGNRGVEMAGTASIAEAFAKALGAGGGVLGANLATGLMNTGIGIMDNARSQLSSFTDQPTIGMSNLELKYAGMGDRSYTLAYSFVGRDEGDIYGRTGILELISQLEAYSYPISRQTDSNRDLIGVPPVWTMEHAVITGNGGFTVLTGSAPLAYLGQPKLLVLETVYAEHFTQQVLVDSAGFTYPLRTELVLRFREMEPLVRAQSDPGDQFMAEYGAIQAPRLFTRSEVYYQA
jgi:hypothetical protein